MPFIDPTKYRLSDSFLLSDFMGCDSVYRRGYQNRISRTARDELRKGEALAEALDLLQDNMGPCRTIYGYISPSLSTKIVKYQDPAKPSHHRWGLGAAADVRFSQEMNDSDGYLGSPVSIAHQIDDLTPYSRLITYSESEYLCLAINPDETTPLRSFYENRYIPGKTKPQFIRGSATPDTRKAQKAESEVYIEENGWKGQGWPRYHGGGRKQYEHEMLGSDFSILDFLYCRDSVHQGKHNRPPSATAGGYDTGWVHCAQMAASVVSRAQRIIETHVSITSAYDRYTPMHQWKNRFTLELALPLSDQAESEWFAGVIEEEECVDRVQIVKAGDENRIRVFGRPI